MSGDCQPWSCRRPSLPDVHRFSQAVGLETTTATRGAFLIQTTALFTPLIAGLTGSEVSATVWLATLLGAGGTALFTASSHPVADAVQQMAPQFGGASQPVYT